MHFGIGLSNVFSNLCLGTEVVPLLGSINIYGKGDEGKKGQ